MKLNRKEIELLLMIVTAHPVEAEDESMLSKLHDLGLIHFIFDGAPILHAKATSKGRNILGLLSNIRYKIGGL